MKVVTCAKCGSKNRVDELRLSNNEAVCGRCGEKLEVAGNGASGKTFVVTDASFQHDVLQATGAPLLVDFWAPWCGPCRIIAPHLEELDNERDDLTVVKMNVDENPETAAKYGIMSIPTLILFKNGQVAKQVVGALPKSRLQQELEPALA
jgi:thioredoxin 1